MQIIVYFNFSHKVIVCFCFKYYIDKGGASSWFNIAYGGILNKTEKVGSPNSNEQLKPLFRVTDIANQIMNAACRFLYSSLAKLMVFDAQLLTICHWTMFQLAVTFANKRWPHTVPKNHNGKILSNYTVHNCSTLVHKIIFMYTIDLLKLKGYVVSTQKSTLCTVCSVTQRLTARLCAGARDD